MLYLERVKVIPNYPVLWCYVFKEIHLNGLDCGAVSNNMAICVLNVDTSPDRESKGSAFTG